jgi:hypothetical protein
MDELTDEDERILTYLDLTAKQVGARLPRLAEYSEDVDIEKWSRARSTTWRVTPE